MSKGRFHLNIITSDIKDDVIQEPNRKLRRLFLQNGSSGEAIQDMEFNDLNKMKIELFNTCCRQANWINRYKYSIKTQILNTQSDLENTVMYCLKDYDEVNPGTIFASKLDLKISDAWRLQAAVAKIRLEEEIGSLNDYVGKLREDFITTQKKEQDFYFF